MKYLNLFLILAILIIVNKPAKAFNFQPLNSGTTNNLISVCFTDVNTGYAVGAYGTIIKTTNAGLNWFFLTSNTTEALRKVYFLNASTGYIVGGNGVMLKTTNAGSSWQISYPGGDILNGVYFNNGQTGWVVGVMSICLKTTNAGINWTAQNIPISTANLHSIVFSNNKGFIGVGLGSSNLLTTTNWGQNWLDSKIRLGDIRTQSIYFNGNFGLAGGFENINFVIRPLIFVTNNLGQNWSEIFFSNRKGVINSISACSSNNNICYAVGNYMNDSTYGNRGLILESTNAGLNWIESPWTDEVSLTDVAVTATDVYIVGCNGLILKSPNPIGIKPIGTKVPEKYELKQNYPNPFNPVTNIEFSIPKKGNVKLSVFDITGKEVVVLFNGVLSEGSYKYDFNANNLSSGIYFYKLTTESFIATKKMILIK